MERVSLRGLWKRCLTCVFVQNFGFVSQPTDRFLSRVVAWIGTTHAPSSNLSCIDDWVCTKTRLCVHKYNIIPL